MIVTGADGYLSGSGWMVRWRWHGDGGLETLASHRMTDERWTIYEPDGSPTTVEAGPEFYTEQSESDSAHEASGRVRRWYAAQGRARTAAGMAHYVSVEGPRMPELSQDDLVWRADNGPWHVVALPVRDYRLFTIEGVVGV